MKYNFPRLTALALISMAGVGSALAVPASPRPVEVVQPDGTKVTLSLRGDEYFHYFQTSDGYIVKEDADGWYRVVDNLGNLTDIAALEISDRDSNVNARMGSINGAKAFESLRAKTEQASSRTSYRIDRLSSTRAKSAPSKANFQPQWDNSDNHFLREFPAEGQQKVLIILVDYADVKWSYCADPGTEMQRMLQEVGYSNYNCTGSAYDYFNESSRGIFQPEFDVYGPVTLPQRMEYYGGNDQWGDDMNPQMMAVHACQILDDKINFADYDRDGDGVVDNIYIFYAGYGENEGASSKTVWPHSWDVRYAGENYSFDNVLIGHYACSNELTYNGNTITGIGTFCHEFSHVLGLPDLYATAYTSATTPGDYTLMDQGSYNNNGRTPPIYSAYERYALEWQKPYEIKGDEDIRMRGLTDGGNTYKMTIAANRPTEYFLFENRQPYSFDKGSPRTGLQVWHIDYQKSKWDSNTVNNTRGDECVILVGGTSFSNMKQTSFTSSTNPAFKNKNGASSSIDVTKITEGVDGIVSFRTGKGMNENSDYYVELPAAELQSISPNSFTLTFPAAAAKAKAQGDKKEKYYISLEAKYFDEKNEAFVAVPVEGYIMKEIDVAETVIVDGVDPLTSYVVNLSHETEANISLPYQLTVLTAAEKVNDTPTVLSVYDIYGDGAALKWVAVEDADHYLLTVATREEKDAPASEGCDFSGSPRIPSDWRGIVGGYGSTDGTYGEASPSAYMSYSDDFLWSAYYEDKEIESVELWLKKSANADVALNVFAATESGAITLLGTIDNITTTGKTYSLTGFPEDIHSLVFLLNDADENTRIYMDDIKINFHKDYVDTPVAGYNNYSVNATDMMVKGLEPQTAYVTYVRTHDGNSEGTKSNTVKFSTTEASGVDGIGSETTAGGYYIVDGTLYSMNGNTAFDVISIDGSIVARGAMNSVKLPSRGVYVIKSKDGTAKMIY